MKNISLFVLSPSTSCGVMEQQCPLMRICPVCGFSFLTARNRRQHQTHCKGDIDILLADAQHDHVVAVHRIRRRRGR